ncbi:ribose-phosphate diphosphokinase [Pseudomonas sp. sp1636]|uniref:ribose-phosphate diphosphokinase n=1 Tax=Pseudomonas sp. sp1636 TaxID=3036707 RepID=UPI0025A63CA7|nr:ribose-phosphate diphosphokinase [Pseudomonas sp. sp1636]MDM8350254.1 ribose-phosphate diphosphokinase [Pseudomonas sp. sp1636]
MRPAYPLLFALRGNQDYGTRVAQRLGCRLAAHEEHVFEDGEHKSRALDPVNGRQAVVFHGLYGDTQYSVHDKLCRLMFFCAALKDAGARRVQVVAPYLCYARKERRTAAQDPIISRYVATLLEASGVDRLLSLEVHNLAAFDNAFRIPTQHLHSAELFAEHFAGSIGAAEVVAVSPDTGGAKRAEQFRQALERRLGRPVSGAIMEKYRNDEALSGTRLSGELQGKTAILFDDMISTGATLLRAGHACRVAGATRLFAAAAHGLFTGGNELLDGALFERLAICDSVPPFRLDPRLAAQRLDILDTTALVATLLAEEYGLPVIEPRP